MPNTQKIKAPQSLFLMLERYELNSMQDCKNAIKEIVQELVLLGLWRAKFFEKAAFYGGTALRILHGLDRFSEDLEFFLLKPDPGFNLEHYEKSIKEELHSFGFKAEVRKKTKTKQSAIDSAFIKVNTLEHLFLIDLPKGINKNIHPNEVLKIRFEVDTDPPMDGAQTESSLLLLPYPFSINTFRLSDLFAGKVHATLCREWKGRVKGRDWYDLIWFVAKGVPLNLNYLEQRMRQSGYWSGSKSLTHSELLDVFRKKIDFLDISSAKNDIINFINDPIQLEIWSKEFFRQIILKIKILEN